MIVVFLMYACFALMFPVAKTLLLSVDPLFAIASRMTVAGIILTIYFHFIQKESLKLSKKAFFHVFLAALSNIFLCNYFEFISLKYLDAAKTSFIYNLSPFLSAVISFFLLHERLSSKKILGLVIGFLGMFPILLSQTSGEKGLMHFFGFISQAEATMLLAVLCTVLGWILMRKLITQDKLSPTKATAYTQIIGGLLALIASYFMEDWSEGAPVRNWESFWKLSLLMLIVSNLIAYNLYGQLLKTFTAPFVAFCGFSTPFFVAIIAYFTHDEVVDMYFFMSCAVVFLGLWLFYQEELKKGIRNH